MYAAKAQVIILQVHAENKLKKKKKEISEG